MQKGKVLHNLYYKNCIFLIFPRQKRVGDDAGKMNISPVGVTEGEVYWRKGMINVGHFLLQYFSIFHSIWMKSDPFQSMDQ